MSISHARLPNLRNKLETLADLKEQVEEVTEEVKEEEEKIVKKKKVAKSK